MNIDMFTYVHALKYRFIRAHIIFGFIIAIRKGNQQLFSNNVLLYIY